VETESEGSEIVDQRTNTLLDILVRCDTVLIFNHLTPFIMPFPLVPVIMGAVSLISSALAARSQKKANESQIAQAQLGYDEQKKMIAQQNAYNSPASQMARYASAGLNPNLIYGQGTPGNQSEIAKYTPPNIRPQGLDISSLPSMIGEFQNFKVQRSRMDLNAAQQQLLSEKARTESVNRMNAMLKGQGLMTGNARARFDLDLAKELRKYNVDIRSSESASAQVKAKMLAKEYALLEQFGSAERQSRLRSQGLQQARTIVGTASEQEKLDLLRTFGYTRGYQQTDLMNQRILSAQEQATFNQLKTKLFREHEMTPNDNFFLRMLIHWMQSEGISAEDIGVPK